MKSHLARFLRSPLGLAVLAVDAGLSAALAVTGILAAPMAGLAFLLLACLSFLVLLQTRWGATAVVAEKDREREERDARILGGLAAARKRLSLLRIADPTVASALERLVYAAGKYLEATVRGLDRDPAAEDAVLGAVEAIDDYLRLEDARSSGRRFRGGGERGEGEAQEAGNVLAERTGRALSAAAEEIERRLDLAAGGIVDGTTAADRSAAREETE